MVSSKELGADEQYEAAVFRAKVEAAIRLVQKESDFTDFSIFTMRVLENKPGKDVAANLGISEPTVSRRLARVRDALRARLAEVVATYSFTDEERQEPARKCPALAPNNTPRPTTEFSAAEDALFDEAIAEIYHRQMELRRQDQADSLR